MSAREKVLSQLFTRLSGINAAVLRGEALPERIDPRGTVILRDGDAGTPDVLLSPPLYSYRHRAYIEVICEDVTDVHSKFDQLLETIRSAIFIDRTLGGNCDWIESQSPEISDPAFSGPPTKAAVVPIIIHYSTSDPLK